MKPTLLSQSRTLLTAAILGAGMVAGMMGVPAMAQLDQATSTTAQSTRESAQSQVRINQLDDQTSDIVAKYRATIDLLESLREYNDQQRKIIADQERQMVSLRDQIDNVSDIEREILPLINRMIEGLDKFVELDAPFLMTERSNRIDNLKALLSRANVSSAEKYRKALEAYQIENDYGRAIEAYDDPLEDGRKVTFLKIGRVAVFYQTTDKSETRMWDNTAREWIDVDDKAGLVEIGIKMAKEQIPPDLLIIPVPAATSAN
jgi:hypothetical protein